MSDLSKAQKVRLGIFLFMAALLVAALVIYKVGGALFEEPDHYIVRIADGVGGLQAGADVTYNGIVIGQVSDVQVDPVDVAMVRLELELAEGTPIPENTPRPSCCRASRERAASISWAAPTGCGCVRPARRSPRGVASSTSCSRRPSDQRQGGGHRRPGHAHGQ